MTTKKNEVVAYSYEQASEYARDVLNNISHKMPLTEFHKIIGVSYSSMMSFKYNIRPQVEMPHVVESILQFAVNNLEHRREFIYMFDPKEFPVTLEQNTNDPVYFIEKVRLPDLKNQLNRLKKIKDPGKDTQVKKEISKVEKEISQLNELVEKFRKRKSKPS